MFQYCYYRVNYSDIQVFKNIFFKFCQKLIIRRKSVLYLQVKNTLLAKFEIKTYGNK